MDPLSRSDANAPNSASALTTQPLAPGLAASIDRSLEPARDAAHRLTQAAGDMAQRSSEQLRHQGQVLREQSALQVREHPLRSLALADALVAIPPSGGLAGSTVTLLPMPVVR